MFTIVQEDGVYLLYRNLSTGPVFIGQYPTYNFACIAANRLSEFVADESEIDAAEIAEMHRQLYMEEL